MSDKGILSDLITWRSAEPRAIRPAAPATPSQHRNADGVHINITEYKESVRQLMADAKRGGVACSFGNLGPEYAQVVVGTMIENAEFSVRVFARCLSKDVYDAKAFKDFLKKHPDGDVEIIVEKEDPCAEDHSALAGLIEEIRDHQISLSYVDPAKLERPLDKQNLCIVDDVYVRIEQNQVTREADVFFANADVGSKETERFDSIADKATPLSI